MLIYRQMSAQKTGQGSSSVDESIVNEPNDIEAVPTLLKEIIKAFDIFTTSNVGRQELLARCRNLVQALETPRETMVYHCWAQASSVLSVLGRSNKINCLIDWCHGWS
jgi:hypothetical protein